MPSLRILRTFLAVSTEGSFTAAGHRVGLTQVAVGLQMRTLEADLKRKLFTRAGKQVALNEQGRALVPIATQLVALYEQAKHGTQSDAPLALPAPEPAQPTEAEQRAEQNERRAFFAEAALAFQKGLAHAFAELLADQAADHVDAAAGRKRHDQPHGLGRVRLRERARADQREQEDGDSERGKSVKHGKSLELISG